MGQIMLPMTPQELENLVRRVVREEIRRVLRRSPTVSEDYQHEGPDDAEQDYQLLQEALHAVKETSNQTEGWKSWEEFEAEIERAEEAGELPD